MSTEESAVDRDLHEAMTSSAVFVAVGEPGVLELTGDDAAEFLQGQLTNDIEAIAPGDGAYAALLDPKGKMRAELRVLRTDQQLVLIADAELLPLIRKTIATYKIGFRFELRDRSSDFAMFQLIGPRSADVAIKVLSATAPLGEAENANVQSGKSLAIRTLLGADLLVPLNSSTNLIDKLQAAGAREADAHVAELARIERGIPRFGAELTESTIPEEAGLNERAVSFTKGCYVGQETVARLHYKGKPNRHLRGLRADVPITAGAAVTAADGRALGNIGSAAVSPAHGPIALAILRREVGPGDSVDVDGVDAVVTDPGNWD